MQNAKDTFYMMLRDRVARLNPERTLVVRGALRPGVLVEENELASGFAAQDTFRLRWSEATIDTSGPRPLVRQHCEIVYSTAGNASNGGMDRGRLLTAMDIELQQALIAPTQRAPKMAYVVGEAPRPLGSQIFWSEATWAPVKENGELLEHTATVDLYSYLEEDVR